MNAFVISLSTQIVADGHVKAIESAMAVLRRDMEALLSGQAEQNRICLIKNTKLQEEGYRICVTQKQIDIDYADELGAVYALLYVSEKYLNVKPLAYWHDQAPQRKPQAYVPVTVVESTPYAVRYRGWFVNDEVMLDGWNPPDMWPRVFETILRLGGNMVIAGTDRKTDDLSLRALEMGLYVTQHHAELLGARMFGRVYPDKVASYAMYPDLFEGLWQESIDTFGGRKMVWAVGFRGQGDSAFWNNDKQFDTDEKRGGLISDIISRQIDMIRAKTPNAVFCTNLYGEMMGLYRKGLLKVPNEVIKVWADNGYGKMVSRRQGNDNPRVDATPDDEGENGIYYHASFYDLQAANHITMSPNAPRMIVDELARVLKHQANVYWLINVGSVKPHLYIIDLIAQMWKEGRIDADSHAASYAKAYHKDEDIGKLLISFSEHTVPFGPNADERAGDQYYHFPLRTMAQALLRGETREHMPSLLWATGDIPFYEQVKMIGIKCEKAVAGWKSYVCKCEAALTECNAASLRDSLVLQATLHLTGCEAMRDFYHAVEAYRQTDYALAFAYVHRAMISNRRGVRAMEAAGHGRFERYYDNECFSNVRLTVQVLQSVRAWLRTCFDGYNFFDWEKRYLMDSDDTRIMLLTHRKNQLDDETLGDALMEKLLYEENNICQGQ